MSDDPQEQDLLAAEYVLGVLTPQQARALEVLALHDQTIADSILAWQNRLAPLAEAVPPQEPPAVLWRRLALATGIKEQDEYDDDEEPARPRRGPPGLFGRPNFWRATTLVGTAIAASLAFLLVQPIARVPLPAPAPVPQGPRELAVLSPAGGPAAAYIVLVSPDGRAAVLSVGTIQPPSGKSFELWALREGTTTPVSLGVLPVTGQRPIPLQGPAGTQLLISLEPQGGSPTGLPTGAVVYSGKLSGA